MRRVIIENVLALIVVVGFFAVLATLIFYAPTQSMDQGTAAIVNQLTGALIATFVSVVSYFFGSSTSSKQKDETISAMAAPTNGKDSSPARTGAGGSGSV